MDEGRQPDRYMLLVTLLLVLGILQYGWVLWPELGYWWGAIDAAVIAGIALIGAMVRMFRK
jgi:hypothetical protein